MTADHEIDAPHPRPCNLAEIAEHAQRMAEEAKRPPPKWLAKLIAQCIGEPAAQCTDAVFDDCAGAFGVADWNTFQTWIDRHPELWFGPGTRAQLSIDAVLRGHHEATASEKSAYAAQIATHLRNAARRITQWRTARMTSATTFELAATHERDLRLTGRRLIDFDATRGNDTERTVTVYETIGGRIITALANPGPGLRENLVSLRPARALEHAWLARANSDPVVQRAYDACGLFIDTLREGARPDAPNALRFPSARFNIGDTQTFGPIVFNGAKIATGSRRSNQGPAELPRTHDLALYRLQNGRLLLEDRHDPYPAERCPSLTLTVAESADALITQSCEHRDVIALCTQAGLDTHHPVD